MSSYNWSPIASGGGGVESLNGLEGALTLAAGTGITITPSGGDTLTIASTSSGDVTLSAFGSSPNANGASLSGQALTLQPASASFPGGVSTTTQAFAGIKTFGSQINADGGIDRSSSGTLTIGATNSTVINIGNSGATVNIQGTTIYENTPQLLVADPLITVNSGGGAGSGQNAGIQVEEASSITGYFQTSSDRNSWQMKAPNTAGIVTVTPGASGFVINQGSHDALTLAAVGSSPNANGASLSGQVLNLQPFSSSFPGVVTASGGGVSNFLRADGSWAAPLDTPIRVANYTIACSVASSNLTIALKTKAGTDPSSTDPVVVSFRSATASSGSYSTVSITSALSIVVPSGATLGRAVTSMPMHVWLINNSGAAELAVSTSPAFASIVSTTTISSGAASAITMYSTTGRSSVPVVSIAMFTINLSNQAVYDAVPAEIVLTNGAIDPSSASTALPTAFRASLAGGFVSSTGIAIGAAAEDRSANGIIIGNGTLNRGTTSVGIGYLVTINGGVQNSIAIGSGAQIRTNAARSISIGTGSSAGDGIDTTDATALGNTAQARSNRSIAIGSGTGLASAGADGSVAIGSGVSPGAFTNVIALAPGSSTAATVGPNANNQFTLGDSRTDSYISDIRLGRGAVATSNAIDVTMGITPISGSNATGKNFILQAGNGTGTGGSGQILFQTAPVAASSSTANTMATRGGWDNAGGFFINGTTSGALTMKAAASTTSHTLTWPSANASGVLTNNGSGTLSWSTGGGDVVGPASSTDNGFARFDGTTGKLLKDSAATISNADVNASAAIAYSKLNLGSAIVNSDISASAAIALSKLAATTASRALVSDGSGFVSAATTTATEIGYVNGVTSAIQTQLNNKLDASQSGFAATAASATITGSMSNVVYGTEEYDAGSMYNNSTGVATVPAGQGGVWFVSCSLQITGTYAVGDAIRIELYKNGTTVVRGGGTRVYTSGSTSEIAEIATTIALAAGDTLQVRALSAATSPSVATSFTGGNFFTMQRMGN